MTTNAILSQQLARLANQVELSGLDTVALELASRAGDTAATLYNVAGVRPLVGPLPEDASYASCLVPDKELSPDDLNVKGYAFAAYKLLRGIVELGLKPADLVERLRKLAALGADESAATPATTDDQTILLTEAADVTTWDRETIRTNLKRIKATPTPSQRRKGAGEYRVVDIMRAMQGKPDAQAKLDKLIAKAAEWKKLQSTANKLPMLK